MAKFQEPMEILLKNIRIDHEILKGLNGGSKKVIK